MKIGRIIVVNILLLLLAAGGCEPRENNTTGKPPENSKPADSVSSAAQNSPDSVLVDKINEMICMGNFEGARLMLPQQAVESSKLLQGMKAIIDQYDQVEKDRQQLKEQAYREQLDELDKLRETVDARDVVDVNDISEVMSVVIKAREYVDEDEKDKILSDPLVAKVITTAKEKGKQFESEGKWVDAYAYCWYWLSTLDEENKEYKEKSEKLMEMAAIEVSLKDDSCGDTSIERHEGIAPEMFLRAINALDVHYIQEIDYGLMADKAIKRCLLLAKVLKESSEVLAFKIPEDESKYEKWITGLKSIETNLSSSMKDVTKNRLLLTFDEVLALNTVTINLPSEIVIAQFSEAALTALDPFTMIVWPWQVQDFQKNMTQQFSGIGVEISKATGQLKVASLLPDTPAYHSGLDADDTIIAVDGEPTEDMTIYCAVSKITGPKGTQVTLTVKHEATGKIEDITITRNRIVVPPLRGWQREADGNWKHFVDPDSKIGYIRITAFTENTVPDTDKILKDLEKQGMEGLIIDLRFNSGGYLVSAAGIVDMFVKEGVIVTSRPRRGWPDEKKAGSWGTHPDYPIVVLINGQSASASEIVAGALQDKKYKRATLVGSRTYGKGSVQVVVPYTGGGSQLKYTMAYYHLPSDQVVKNRYVLEKEGRKDWGIGPDVEVDLMLKELRDMIDVQRENDVLAKADHDSSVAPMKRHSLQETLESDAQLRVGILVLKSKIIKAMASK